MNWILYFKILVLIFTLSVTIRLAVMSKYVLLVAFIVLLIPFPITFNAMGKDLVNMSTINIFCAYFVTKSYCQKLSRYHILALIFVLMSAISILINWVQLDYLSAIRQFSYIVSGFALFSVIHNIQFDRRTIQFLFRCLMIGFLMQIVVSIIQYHFPENNIMRFFSTRTYVPQYAEDLNHFRFSGLLFDYELTGFYFSIP